MILGFKDLRVWKLGHGLTLEVYRITGTFPEKEKFGIISQLRRCSSSVAANIVEGQSRHSTKEFMQFLYQARGSLAETQYFLILATDLQYMSKIENEKLQEQYEQLSRQLNALIVTLRKKI